MSRSANVERTTNETKIRVQSNLDGTGQVRVDTGIGFFDHMLDLWAHHGCFDLSVEAEGDLRVDFHHTVEDTGITLGQALRQALGEKAGITRFGCAFVPMDESLTRVVVDLSGRPFLRYAVPGDFGVIGAFPFQLVEEFCRAFSVHAMLNLHVDLLAGKDSHHVAESIFKGLGRSLAEAVRTDSRRAGIPSTKGIL
jgi:imidazoleglycerol-phosphate dehydratase